MAEKIGGPNSLQVALVLNNLTKVYEDQSRFDEVEQRASARLQSARASLAQTIRTWPRA